MASSQELNRSPDLQVFSSWLVEFLRKHKSDVVVDIGSDPQLKLALMASRNSEVVHSINFPNDHRRMRGWHKLHQEIGATNIRLTSGDALNLGSLVPHSDVIILHNVLLDGNNGNDTDLMWQYRRGEKKFSNKEWGALWERFDQAELDGFAEFLNVASPGYIIRFSRTDEEDRFMKVLIEKLKVEPSKIKKQHLRYDDQNEEQRWEVYVIDNTQS